MISRRNPPATCSRCSGHGLVRCPECRAMYQPWLSVGVLRCPFCHGLGYVRCPECFEACGKQRTRPGAMK
jgi:hypothetical protein